MYGIQLLEYVASAIAKACSLSEGNRRFVQQQYGTEVCVCLCVSLCLSAIFDATLRCNTLMQHFDATL